MSRTKALAYFLLALGGATLAYFAVSILLSVIGIQIRPAESPVTSLLALSLPIALGMGSVAYLFWRYIPQAARPSLYKPMPVAVWVLMPLWIVLLQPLLATLSLDAERFSLPTGWKDLEAALEASEAHIDALLRQIAATIPLGAIIATALAPGIFEELLFRGVLMSYMQYITMRVAAIWIVGVLFSIYHLQPYGLVPRAILGVAFGYFVVAHRSLLPAMYAHFLNNALMVTLVALSEGPFAFLKPYFEMDYHPPLTVGLASGILALLLGRYIYKKLC